MPTHHDDIELVCGDEWFIVGKLLDENGNPFDLTPDVILGWSIVGPDGNMLAGLDDAVTLDKQPGGIVNITVPDSFTRKLQPARYLDAIRVWADGAPATQWVGVILADADPFHPTVELAPAPEVPALPPPVIDEPPDDGQLYVRQAGQWVVLTLPPPPPTDEVSTDAPQDGKFYARRNGQWIEMPSGFSTIFEYTFDNGVTVPPNNSQLRFDNASLTVATKIWLHNSNADGVDVSNLLTMVQAGFTIFVQDKNDPTQRARFYATGPMANLGTYCELPVQFVASAGTLTDNQRVIVVVYGGG